MGYSIGIGYSTKAMIKSGILEHFDRKFFGIKKYFPKNSRKFKTFLYLNLIDFLLFVKNIRFNGVFSRKVDPLSLFAWKKFAKYNPFHFGEYVNNGKYFGLDYFEHNTIIKILDLYKADKKNMTGMVLSGATEGNMYSMWLGREYFYRKGINDVYVLTTKITDASITKLGRVMNFSMLTVDIDDKFAMSSQSLEKEVSKLAHKKTKVGLLVCLTLGYKQTGSSDNYMDILGVIRKLEKQYTNVNFYVWMDAASEGFLKPLTERFRPFENKLIKTVVFDTHKPFLTPHTVGVILFRRSLLNSDNALSNGILESRSSIPGISLWAVVQGLGSTGVLKLIKKSHATRSYFLNRIKSHLDILKIISPESSFSLTLEIKKEDFTFFKSIENLLPVKTSVLTDIEQDHFLVKIYFFPDLRKESLDVLFNHFENVQKK